jgi:Carboxypeptidase regulatory-like domain
MRSSHPTSNIMTCSCLLAMFIALFGSPTRGQSTFGSVVGTVSDATDDVIPGARLTLINLATNESRSALADSNGHYQFLNLLPASYRLEAEQSGFKRFLWDRVVVGCSKR